MLNLFDNSVLGKNQTVFPYPSEQYDFNRFPPLNDTYAMKYYGIEMVQEGKCGVLYKDSNESLVFEWDPLELPWLGVWVTAGAWHGDYNFAMEMTSGFYDIIGRAIEQGKIVVLQPGEKRSYHIRISLMHRCK